MILSGFRFNKSFLNISTTPNKYIIISTSVHFSFVQTYMPEIVQIIGSGLSTEFIINI